MPIDVGFVGRKYPPTDPYLVGREKIREFADAIGDDNPLYRDPQLARAAGHPDVIAPPTFTMIIIMSAGRQLIDDPAVGMDYSRVVHGDQKFRYVRPVHAGDRLVCVVVVEDITSRIGHDFVTTRHEISTVDGEPVVTGWMKLVVRGEEEGA